MDVAVMGAGLSGLSCALTLERNGINPVIFEKRTCVGDRFVNGEALFSIFNRPIKDGLHKLAEKYEIHLDPTSSVTRFIIHSKNQIGSIDGKIGYINIRGRHRESCENQLARKLISKINFNMDKDVKALGHDFEHVVLATGDGAYANDLGNYRCDLTLSLKGATVEGTFSPDTPHVWFNYDIIPKGYAWLLPYSECEANLVIAYPDYLELKETDIKERWDKFYELARKDLAQDLTITDQFQITGYMAGICLQPKVDNIYFVGNNFGALSPGLGFGQFTSILTGIYAAYDICRINNYEELVKPLFDNYKHSLTLRRYLESMDDDKFDLVVKGLNIKLLKDLAERITSTESSFDLLKWMTPLLALMTDKKSETT